MASSLYRHFDASGNLLYVGASRNPFARNVQHLCASDWKDEIAVIKIEPISDWLLFEAEKAAILKEQPLHNVVCKNSPKPKKIRPPYVSKIDISPFDSWSEKERLKYLRLPQYAFRPIFNESRDHEYYIRHYKLNENTVEYIKTYGLVELKKRIFQYKENPKYKGWVA